MLVVPKPAKTGSSYDQRENVPKEDPRSHGFNLPKTRLAIRCNTIAGRIQAITPRKDTSSPLPGVKLKVLPRTPTARNAVERRSRLFASSLVRSLCIKLISPPDHFLSRSLMDRHPHQTKSAGFPTLFNISAGKADQAASAFGLMRPRATSNSAIWIVLRAAPLRRLSETTHMARPFSTVISSRMRLI